MVFLYVVAGLGALAGAVTLIMSILLSTGAPQQAAGAAIAVALAVIPYVLARAIQLVSTEDRKKRYERHILERLDKLIETQEKARAFKE